ncbi:hypothetical protein VDGD_20611 [Verticillium dahliae]|nr:hypothetical protein VDGD_20611 [Verticillium dahliae]
MTRLVFFKRFIRIVYHGHGVAALAADKIKLQKSTSRCGETLGRNIGSLG